MRKLFPHGVDSARVIQVIETKSARGSGTPEQPTRIVTEYWSLDGEKLAEQDPHRGEMVENPISVMIDSFRSATGEIRSMS